MILVTGATGFLGSHLVYALLKQGVKVRALKRETSSVSTVDTVFASYGKGEEEITDLIEWVTGDILDIHSLLDALEGITHVYHCAAQVSFDSGRRQKLMQVNVSGTANLVDACVEKGIRKLCHVSSIGALGSAKPTEAIDEESPRKSPSSYSPYSRSKYLAEMEVWRGVAEGLNAVVVNPAVILGPGNAGSLGNTLFDMVKKGMKYGPPGSNAFVDVRDVVNVMILLMEKPDAEERYTVLSENLTYTELLEMAARHLGNDSRVLPAGKRKLALYAALNRLKARLTGTEPLISKHLLKIMSGKSIYSGKKLADKLNYHFIPVETTVSELCAAYIRTNLTPR